MFFVDEGLQKVLRSLGFWIREKLLRSGIFNDLSVIQKQDPVRDCPGKLESAYILHRCARYDIKGKELLKTQEKFYLADTALRYSVLGYNADSAAAMLENIVYLELLRRGYEVCIGKLDGHEIDFIATKQDEKIYVQVAQQISSEAIREREYGRLLALDDNYPKYVLLADDYAGGNYKGIKTIHIADFLLSKDF